MTNTIPNVPRELLERVLNAGWGSETVNALDDLRDFLESAPSPANHVEDVRAMVADPSPAGVDGLEVVGWYRMDDRKAITPYPSVCATWHKMGVKVGAAYSDSAHAIIDGLLGEVGSQRIKTCTALKERNDAREEHDQQAQRIGELEGLLREERTYASVPSSCQQGIVARCICRNCRLLRIDALLSAGKEGA